MGNLCTGCSTIEEQQETSKKSMNIYDVEYYQTRYQEKFETIENNESSSSDLENFFILEHTPQGNIIMKYDLSEKRFYYYSDRSIPNYMLEVASKKFAIQVNSKHVYHASNAEPGNDEKEENEENEENDVNKEKTKKDTLPDVYGKFKQKQKKHVSWDDVDSNINIFRHEGRLCDFDILKAPPQPEKKSMSYLEYVKHIYGS